MFFQVFQPRSNKNISFPVFPTLISKKVIFPVFPALLATLQKKPFFRCKEKFIFSGPTCEVINLKECSMCHNVLKFMKIIFINSGFSIMRKKITFKEQQLICPSKCICILMIKILCYLILRPQLVKSLVIVISVHVVKVYNNTHQQ